MEARRTVELRKWLSARKRRLLSVAIIASTIWAALLILVALTLSLQSPESLGPGQALLLAAFMIAITFVVSSAVLVLAMSNLLESYTAYLYYRLVGASPAPRQARGTALARVEGEERVSAEVLGGREAEVRAGRAAEEVAEAEVEGKRKCPYCGRELPFGDVHIVCPYCGRRLK